MQILIIGAVTLLLGLAGVEDKRESQSPLMRGWLQRITIHYLFARMLCAFK
jgi:hypothetical protein